MNEIQKIYETELEEVGYLEKASNAYLDDKTKNAGYNNITKYWRDLRKMGRMAIYGYSAGSSFVGGASWPYCAAGQDWSFVKALGVERASELLLHGTSAFINCQTMYNKAKAASRIVKKPQAGALALFYNSSGTHYHVEFIYKVDDTRFYTIGFNTSGASSVVANGGGVCAKKYAITSTAAHFFLPEYKGKVNLTDSTAGTSVTYLKYGSKGDAVKDIQTKLIYLGYSCGVYGSDGEFGSGTMAAVKMFQKTQNLTVDGIVGEKTSTALNVAYEAKKNAQTASPDKTEVLFVGKCTGNDVNVRIWAGTEYGNISSYPHLNKDNLVDVMNYTQTASDGSKWYYVRIAGKYHGFVHSKYIQKA